MGLELVRKLIGTSFQYVVEEEASGGSAVLKSTPRTLTDAEVKALPGADVELIAAPGSGRMIVPVVAYLVNDFAVAYSGIDANTQYPAVWVAHKSSPIYLAEFIDNPSTPLSEVPQAGLTSFLTNTNEFGPGFWPLFPVHRVGVVDISGDPEVGLAAGSTLSGGGGGGPADYEDVSFKIGADNSVDFTGGDDANTLTVTVLYTILDV